MVKLDILSDPICPWCYIGKGNLDRALTEVMEHPFTIEWHPFQLNPDMPLEGRDRVAHLSAKFGGPDAFAQAESRVEEMAKTAGLEINNALITRTPNTMNAHRLIHWAGIEGKQLVVVDRLFRANFVEGRDIGNAEVLADIADSVEMDAALVTRLLDSDADVADIRARDKHSREMGVNAVPTFIIANQHAVPGAQTTESWLEIIRDIQAQLDAAE